MRTTLDIDLDVLQAAKEMASQTKQSAGQILSDLARKALSYSAPASPDSAAIVNGFEILPADGRLVTSEFVQKLNEDSEQA